MKHDRVKKNMGTLAVMCGMEQQKLIIPAQQRLNLPKQGTDYE